jgi:carboxylate-amine ligase
MDACAPHADALGCDRELALLKDLLDHPSPARQRHLADVGGLHGLVAALAADFSEPLDRLERDLTSSPET